MTAPDSSQTPTRRALLRAGLLGGFSAGAGLLGHSAFATAPPGFDEWRDKFRTRAFAKGISQATWNRTMARVEPDMTVFKEMEDQPEFTEQTWQYINRRVSDWRIIRGKEALRKH
jgi:membrane-bound lytic murein transglycosylase B